MSLGGARRGELTVCTAAGIWLSSFPGEEIRSTTYSLQGGGEVSDVRESRVGQVSRSPSLTIRC